MLVRYSFIIRPYGILQREFFVDLSVPQVYKRPRPVEASFPLKSSAPWEGCEVIVPLKGLSLTYRRPIKSHLGFTKNDPDYSFIYFKQKNRVWYFIVPRTEAFF